MDSNQQIDESFIRVEAVDVLRVFNKDHPIPSYAVNGNEQVVNLLKTVIN